MNSRAQINQEVSTQARTFTSAWSWLWIGFFMGLAMAAWFRNQVAPSVHEREPAQEHLPLPVEEALENP